MSEGEASLSGELESEEDEEDSGTWNDWTEAGDEEEGAHILCLFCSLRWASAASVFEHCKSEHAFDFIKLQKQFSLGFYDCIRLINFIRSQDFDILSIQADDVDFTATFELSALAYYSTSGQQFAEDHVQNGEESLKGRTSIVTTERWVWCYGVVVWFDVGFTSRYCKQNPVRLSTSPHFPRTHWSQTLLTFKEPIALLQSQSLSISHNSDGLLIGTNDSPASALKGRISVARSSRHRSIDISLETTAVGPGGGTRLFPVQIFEI